eukprot:4879225-Pleurochrysis_carterae.AAC.1
MALLARAGEGTRHSVLRLKQTALIPRVKGGRDGEGTEALVEVLGRRVTVSACYAACCITSVHKFQMRSLYNKNGKPGSYAFIGELPCCGFTKLEYYRDTPLGGV